MPDTIVFDALRCLKINFDFLNFCGLLRFSLHTAAVERLCAESERSIIRDRSRHKRKQIDSAKSQKQIQKEQGLCCI